MGARDRFRDQQLNPAALQHAGNEARGCKYRQAPPPGIEEGCDSPVDASHDSVDILRPVTASTKQRYRRYAAFDDVDLQQEEEEQDHHNRESEKSPKNLSSESLPKRVVDQRCGGSQ